MQETYDLLSWEKDLGTGGMCVFHSLNVQFPGTFKDFMFQFCYLK